MQPTRAINQIKKGFMCALAVFINEGCGCSVAKQTLLTFVSPDSHVRCKGDRIWKQRSDYKTQHQLPERRFAHD